MIDSDLAFSAIRISTPLIFAAMGGLVTYQVGMLNIALDGFMIVAAFTGIAVAYATSSLALGVFAGIASAMLLAAMMALFNLRFRAHIFIVGIAVIFLAYGLTALLLKGVLGEDGVFTSDRIPVFPEISIPLVADIPFVGPAVSGHTILVYLAYLSVPIVAWVLYKTRWGLRARAVGEAEPAAAAAGIPVGRTKFQAMLLSGLLCGVAGAYLSLGYVSLFAKEMTNERGLIALAAMFFGAGNPYKTALAAVFFGVATALSVRLPEATAVAPQLLQSIPYLVTLVALVLVGIRSRRYYREHRAWQFDTQ